MTAGRRTTTCLLRRGRATKWRHRRRAPWLQLAELRCGARFEMSSMLMPARRRFAVDKSFLRTGQLLHTLWRHARMVLRRGTSRFRPSCLAVAPSVRRQ
jgi:hypothetical protein